jgi:predicted aminopeptidase
MVPSGAPACPECGSDEETGWSESAAFGFLYDEEPGTSPSRPTPWTTYLTIILASLTLVAFLAYRLAWGMVLVPVAFLVVGVAYYATRVSAKTGHSREKQLYQRLLQQARGDEELVHRLIEYERQRSPGSDRLELLQDAIYRWERDNR